MKSNTARKYRIALIGCGQMGKVHLDDIYLKDNVIIKYVCDLNIKTARECAKKYGAKKAVSDAEQIFSDDEVDIVIVATYPSTHFSLVKRCIETGKHVICEKPIAENADEAKAFVKMVRENPSVKVLIGYILRHNDTYNKVCEMIRGGAIGKPIVMRMMQNHHTMDWQRYLKLIKETSPIIDCGVHYIDVMQWFTDAKITDISGISLRTEADVPEDKYNYGLITVKLSDGSVGFYEAGWSNTMASDNLKEFVGPKGRIRIIYEENRTENKEEGDLIEYYRYPEKRYESINLKSKRKPTGKQLDCLIGMIENDLPANPTIDEAYDSFLLAQKADKIIKGENIK